MSDLMFDRAEGAPRTHQRAGWNKLVASLMLALRTHATRRALPALSSHLLADIGLSRSAALAEAARLPWDTCPTQRRERTSGLSFRVQRTLQRLRARRLLVNGKPNGLVWGG